MVAIATYLKHKGVSFRQILKIFHHFFLSEIFLSFHEQPTNQLSLSIWNTHAVVYN